METSMLWKCQYETDMETSMLWKRQWETAKCQYGIGKLLNVNVTQLWKRQCYANVNAMEMSML